MGGWMEEKRMNEKISKLPKWAQDEFKNLMRKNKELEDQNNRIKNNFSGNGHIYVDFNLFEDLRTDIHRVKFRFDNSEIEASIIDRGAGKFLEIRGMYALQILPNVTNAIQIRELNR